MMSGASDALLLPADRAELERAVPISLRTASANSAGV